MLPGQMYNHFFRVLLHILQSPHHHPRRRLHLRRLHPRHHRHQSRQNSADQLVKKRLKLI